MEYTLYTTVDITHTGQYRPELGKEADRWKEQNFQTLLQTIGLRSNIIFRRPPDMIQVSGKQIGFATDHLVRAWRFDFSAEHEGFFETDNSPTGALIEDFDGVPFIAGLDESMTQNFASYLLIANKV
jgi:hypothetical protein